MPRRPVPTDFFPFYRRRAVFQRRLRLQGPSRGFKSAGSFFMSDSAFRFLSGHLLPDYMRVRATRMSSVPKPFLFSVPEYREGSFSPCLIYVESYSFSQKAFACPPIRQDVSFSHFVLSTGLFSASTVLLKGPLGRSLEGPWAFVESPQRPLVR